MARRLLVLLTLCFSMASAAPEYDEAASWSAACKWTEALVEISCEDIDPPRVITLPPRMINRFLGPGTRGFFLPMAEEVYIREGMTPLQTHETLTHEMVHYIIDQKARGRFSRCENEEVAWMVGALTAGKPYSSAWKGWYRCDPKHSVFS